MKADLDIALPNSWSWSPLKSATTFLNRGTAPDYVDEGPVRAISQASNQAGGLDWTRTRFHAYSGDPRKLRGYLVHGDVLINSTGNGTLGRVGYFIQGPDETPCVADGHVTVARADRHTTDPRYLYYWFNSSLFQDYTYSALVVGATNQIELSRERLASAPVPVPPLDEQRRIADFLDAETARIDGLIASKQQMIILLEERVQSIINQITLGQLVHGLDGKPTGITGMQSVRLGALAAIEPGFAMDPRWKDRSGSVTAPYLRVANVHDGSLALDDVKEVTLPMTLASRCTLRPGDVLMTEGGDPDKLGRGTVWSGEISPCLHQNAIFAVRPDSRLLPEYLALVTRTGYARTYFEMTATKSTGIAHTSSTKITGFRVPMRPIEEQKQIVQRVHESLARIDALRTPVTVQVELLAERRQALITAAVTGEIDVTTAGRAAEAVTG